MAILPSLPAPSNPGGQLSCLCRALPRLRDLAVPHHWVLQDLSPQSQAPSSGTFGQSSSHGSNSVPPCPQIFHCCQNKVQVPWEVAAQALNAGVTLTPCPAAPLPWPRLVTPCRDNGCGQLSPAVASVHVLDILFPPSGNTKALSLLST